jgi:hypothetical protein
VISIDSVSKSESWKYVQNVPQYSIQNIWKSSSVWRCRNNAKTRLWYDIYVNDVLHAVGLLEISVQSRLWQPRQRIWNYELYSTN